MDKISTGQKIINFLVANSTGMYTAQEIANAIAVHRTTVQRSLAENHLPGIVLSQRMRRTGTRTAEQYYFDINAAQRAHEEYEAARVSPTILPKDNDMAKIPNNSLATKVLDVSGIPKEMRESIAESLNIRSLSVNQIRQRMTNGIAMMDADENQSDEQIREWLILISAVNLQMAIDLGK